MKIAVSVDNHFDVNKLSVPEAITRISAYLMTQQPAGYFNAGDSFNDFTKSAAFYRDLQAHVPFPVRWLAGNHDLVNGVSYEIAQSHADPLYFHEQSLRIGKTVIIGNNGWYDYSLAPADLDKTDAEFTQWKQAYWIDGAIDQPVSDKQRMQRVLATTTQALDDAKGQHVIYLTHFVPQKALMIYAPGHSYWQMATAVMGSQHLGDLLNARHVDSVVFGHLHKRHAPLTIDHTTYYHQPMGYGLHRLNEWDSDDWFEQWRKTLVWLEV
ncbi:metallophosphoesterase [Lacticaseibacillus porcinae]|uniref:metallophosphoesterase n=1 Tax=Lacticaseibacillus porcinae TaxID=1123687 RepID=UPI000F79D93A|nr:metallophosphoesterase [Lacticaseibacillus porcinae]